MRATPDPPSQEQHTGRLESWKEIAAFLGRDVRTVQRWEAREGLPIRRHVHQKRPSVYAVPAELQAWWENRKPDLEEGESGISLGGALPHRLKPVPQRLKLVLLGFGALGLVALAGWVILASRPRPVQVPARAPSAPRILALSTAEGRRPRFIPVGGTPIRLAMTRGGELYVLLAGASVRVIRMADETVTHTVPVVTSPNDVVVSSDGRHVYVPSQTSDISVIDTATKAVRTIPTHGAVWHLAVAPDGGKVFVAMAWQGLKRLNPVTGELASIPGTVCPVHLAFDPPGRRLYVSYRCGGPGGRRGHDAVDIMDPATETSLGSVAGPPLVGGQIVVSPDGAYVWVHGSDACSAPYYDHQGCPVVPGEVFHVLRASDRKVIQTLGFPAQGIGGIAFFPKGWLATLSGELLRVVDTATFTVRETLDLGTGGLAFTPDGRRAYALANRMNAVAVFDILGPGCEPPLEGLVNFWPGDGNANDVFDGRPGTLRGGAEFAAGLVGQAFQLDGKGGLVDFGPRVDFTFFGDATLSLWVKFLSLDGRMPILDRMTAAGDDGWSLFKDREDSFVFCLGSAAGRAGCVAGSRVAAASGAKARKDAWHHLAVVKAANGLQLYVDGSLKAVTALGSFSNEFHRNELRIGGGQAAGEFLHGLVDEVAVWHRALGRQEVQDLFRAGKDGSCLKQ